MTRAIGIIPARMASSRLPGKPLVPICGVPMVGHVYFRSKMSQSLNEVYIATCDEEIYEYANSIGAKGVMTANTHERATDRSAEALKKIEAMVDKKVDIAVMIQGDEPLLVPKMIDDVIAPLKEDSNIVVANLMSPLKNQEEHEDPNEVKVVVDRNGFALYFSREPIPSSKKGGMSIPMMRQLGIIPFQRDFLMTFNDLSPTSLEIIESIDMLRLLEHGYKVKMVPFLSNSYTVDTIQDLRKVEQLMINDPLLPSYT